MIIIVNKQKVSFSNGRTVLQVCEKNSVSVPRFCYHSNLKIAGNCRMCLIEVKGVPKPVAACALPAAEGIEVFTESPIVWKAREGVIEFLLVNHPLDCPICDQGGECDLQDQSYVFGRDRTRFYFDKRRVLDKNIGPVVHAIITRCILCTRCIRFSSEVGQFSMVVTGRGRNSEVGTYVSKKLKGSLSGNLIDLCPVGALTKKPYLFQGRPWETSNVTTLDTRRGEIKPIRVEKMVSSGDVFQVSSIQTDWLSDRTRFAYNGLGKLLDNKKNSNPAALAKVGSIVIGEDIRRSDLRIISFYRESNMGPQFVFSSGPMLDRTRPSMWGLNSLERNVFSRKDLVILVGTDFNVSAPVFFRKVIAFSSKGGTVLNFGYSSDSHRVSSYGFRIGQFLSFVEGKHSSCLYPSDMKKVSVFFSTDLWRNIGNVRILNSVVDKLVAWGVSVHFISSFANEVRYAISPIISRGNAAVISTKKRSAFGYVNNKVINQFVFGFGCGNSGCFQSLPLAFQRTEICRNNGQFSVLPKLPLKQGGIGFSVKDVLFAFFPTKSWREPVLKYNEVFLFGPNRYFSSHVLDFVTSVKIGNTFLSVSPYWSSLSSWSELRSPCRQQALIEESRFSNFSVLIQFLFIMLGIILSSVLQFLGLVVPLLITVAFFTLVERKVLSSTQRRRGPNVVGVFGLTQALADGLKLFSKESVLPTRANLFIFILSPLVTFILALLLWVCLPIDINIVFSDLPLGILYIFAISSLRVYGVLMAGWSSNSAYAFLGALRSTAQIISYEVSIGFIMVSVLLSAGSLNLRLIVQSQIRIWFCFPLFPVFLMFLVSILAETNRHPFDLPEAEAELVSGYNVEYSAIGFALFFLGEYRNIIGIRSLTALLFLGGWLPIPGFEFVPGFIWIGFKTLLLICFFILARAAYPRYRYDQLMRIGWKVFLPLSLSYVIFTASILFAFDGFCA